MALDRLHFTPLGSLAGGLLIGLAAALFLLANGRIAGIVASPLQALMRGTVPHPKLMHIAVPANLLCGRPVGPVHGPGEPAWAPLTFTFGGLWELQPAALAERIAGPRRADIQIIDVREPAEFCNALRPIPGAQLLPLSQLTQRVGEIDPERPVVAVCRSGTRSAQAVVLLQKSGFKDAANLAGGMLRWRAESCGVAGGIA